MGHTTATGRATDERLYDYFVSAARKQHPVVETGIFGATMQISLVKDDPVTIPMQN